MRSNPKRFPARTYQRWLSDAPRRKQEREQALVAITAIDKAQASTVKAEMERGEPGTPGSCHLIADKPDYNRIKGSRLEVRSLLIGFRLTDSKQGDQLHGDLFDRAVSDSYRAFDWAAAARLLGPASK